MSLGTSPALIWIILSLGAFLRLHHYLGNRCLWYDEVVWAEHILSRSFAGLMSMPLNDIPPHTQVGPPGFLLTEKTVSQALGSSEMALRLFPFIVSLAALILFWRLARRVLEERAVLIAAGLFALSRWPNYYAAEVKHYALDIAAAIILYLATARVLQKKDQTSNFVLLLGGVLAIWFSFPSAFVLAGIGIVLMVQAVKVHDWKKALWPAGMSLAWLASFCLFMYVIRFHSSGVTFVRGRWSNWDGFPPLPNPVNSLKWVLEHFFGIFNNPLGFYLASGAAAFVFLFGALFLWKRSRAWLWLLLLPMGIALAASALHLYPFSDRLLVFLLPGFILIIALGLNAFWEETQGLSRLAAVLLTVLLFVLPLLVLASHTFKKTPFEHGNMRAVLNHIQSRAQPADTLYFTRRARVGWLYYQRFYDLRGHPIFLSQVARNKWDDYQEEVRRLPGGARVWVIFFHDSDAEEKEMTEKNFLFLLLEKRGRCLDRVHAEGASAYLFEIIGEFPENTLLPLS